MNLLTILVIVNIIVFIYAKKELKGVKKELHEVKGELEETKHVNQEIYKWNLKLTKENKEAIRQADSQNEKRSGKDEASNNK